MQALKGALFATGLLVFVATHSFADEGLVVCKTMSSAAARKAGSANQRSLLKQEDECFALPADWKILVSNESKEFTAMTVAPPGNAAPMSVWSAQRVGED